jgi:glycosyltransferase involved in cell wall biosynthesis
MQPYISIVIACRNDSYAGPMVEKLKASLAILCEQLHRYEIPAEIIIVDWNPPSEFPSMYEELKLFQPGRFIKLVVIEVPPEIHKKYKYHQLRSIVGDVAVNVGIRRASGKFVLFKAADSFYSESLVSFLSSKKLNPKAIYRVDRVDVNVSILSDSVSYWEKHFSENIIFRYAAVTNEPHVGAAGDFLLMARESWFKVEGVPESDQAITLGNDGEVIWAAMGYGINEIQLEDPCRVYKITHSGLHSSRVKESEQTLFIRKCKNVLSKTIFFNLLKVFGVVVYGLLNIPITKASGIRTRSWYRYQLICWIRGYLPFIYMKRQKNWGLAKLNLKTITIFDGLGDKIK